jgi:outer membrane receptor protein involved in Fe transport
MRKFGLLGTSALGSFTFIGLSIALATPAYAQGTAADAQTDDEAQVGQSEAEIESGTRADTGAQGENATAASETGESITITGSRIRRPNLDSAVPITSVSGEEFFETGQVSIGDVLNELPQLRSTFSQANSTRFLGTRGLNLLDLRGLGTQRTLVLVNGRRHVPGDVLNNAVSPDVNTFPTDLIERVDLITGGGSSIYGSDAIAGVVNFILKSNYDGIQVRGQSGISKYGDAANQYVSVLAGRNFAGDRGNIAINLEYARQSDYYVGGRPISSVNGFIVVDTDPAGAVNGSDGNPDRIFVRDTRATTPVGGSVFIRQAATAANAGLDPTGAAYSLANIFGPDGSVQTQSGARIGLAPIGTFVGGNAPTGREGNLLALSPQLDRYSVNVIGHFEVSPAIVPFIEAKYVRSDAFGSQSGPFFSQGQTLGDGINIAGFNDRSYAGATTTAANSVVNREGIRLDNPFLSPAARAALAAQLTTAVNANTNPNTGGAIDNAASGTTNRTRALAQIADGSFRFNLRKNFAEFGIRDEQFRRETYRAVVGVRGDFNDDWNYEISANYGEHRESNLIIGNINRQRYLLAADVVRNPAGQIVCRSQLDPAFAGTDRAGNPAQLAADVAACVPLNPFGAGSSSQAVRDYLLVDSQAEGKITQFVLGGFVAGDLSQLFELPGGAIGFSLGAEYRRETVFYDLDDITQQGYAFYNAIPTLDPPSFKVKEVFGEISIPLLKDMPFFQELTITGSGRISDYNTSAGTTYAYGGELSWRPIQDIQFRAAYNRAVRAPNLSELFTANTQNFAPAPNDPCAARNIGTGSATRAANCAAAGRPAGYDFVYTSSLEIISGGNPDLREESSDNYTVGGVFTPRFIPGFSISSDYYDITVNDVITAVSAQNILNLCYDSPTLDNPFCPLFQRAGAGGGPRGEQQFRVLEGNLFQRSLNFAKLKVRGVDTEIAYRRKLGDAQVNLRAVWTHTFQNDSFTNPADPTFANRLLKELGDPQDEVNFNASVKSGGITLGYQARWIEKMYLNTYEDYNPLNGQPPQNADYADIRFYPSVIYHDARIDFEAGKRFNFYLGIDNITNRMPPFGLTGVGAGSGIYDIRGRYFYAGAVAKF